MPPPERENYHTVIRGLETRIARLEQTLKAPIFLRNNVAPDTPVGGGAVYVQGGALHYIGSSGTDTPVAPA